MEVEWLEGRISVEAAIVAKRRSIETVYIHKKKREHQFGSLLQLTESADIPVKFANDAFFTDHARGKSHGGVLALVGSRKYSEPKDLLEANGIVFRSGPFTRRSGLLVACRHAYASNEDCEQAHADNPAHGFRSLHDGRDRRSEVDARHLGRNSAPEPPRGHPGSDPDVQFRRALELHPRDPELMRRLGNLYASDWETYREAIEVFRELAGMDPADPELYRYLARLEAAYPVLRPLFIEVLGTSL